MWIIFRLCLVVVFAIFKFVYRKGVEGDRHVGGSDGRFVYFVEKVKSKHGVRKTQVMFETSSQAPFHLVPEHMGYSLLKSLGWNAEVQTGDDAFDSTFYVASDSPAFIRRLKLDQELRGAFKTLLSEGWRKIRCENQVVVAEQKGDVTPTDATVEALRLIEVNLAKDFANSDSGDPYLWRIVAMELLLWGGLGYCVGAFVHMQLDRATELLEPWPLILPGLGLSAGLLAAWLVILLLTTRKSARAPLLIVESFIGLLIGLVILGPRAMFDANKAFDGSPPTPHVGHVTSKNKVISGSGKNKTTRYYLYVRGEFPAGVSDRLEVNSSDFWRFNPPQEITIVTHEGYFGARYVADLVPGRSMPDSASASVPQTIEADMQMNPKRYATEALMWRPMQVSGGKAFVKYGPGRALEFEGRALDGKLVGEGTYFHPNGTIQMKVNFVDGKKNGRYKVFRQDGTREGDFTMKDDKPHGWMRWYDATGKLEREEIYFEGNRLNLTPAEKDEFTSRGFGL